MTSLIQVTFKSNEMSNEISKQYEIKMTLSKLQCVTNMFRIIL